MAGPHPVRGICRIFCYLLIRRKQRLSRTSSRMGQCMDCSGFGTCVDFRHVLWRRFGKFLFHTNLRKKNSAPDSIKNSVACWLNRNGFETG